MSKLQEALRNPQKLAVLAQGLAERGVAPPRDMMIAGLQGAAQKVKQQQAAPQVGGQGPAQPGQLMNPQARTTIPQSMPQVPFAPSSPAPITGIGDLMTPRGN